MKGGRIEQQPGGNHLFFSSSSAWDASASLWLSDSSESNFLRANWESRASWVFTWKKDGSTQRRRGYLVDDELVGMVEGDEDVVLIVRVELDGGRHGHILLLNKRGSNDYQLAHLYKTLENTVGAEDEGEDGQEIVVGLLHLHGLRHLNRPLLSSLLSISHLRKDHPLEAVSDQLGGVVVLIVVRSIPAEDNPNS